MIVKHLPKFTLLIIAFFSLATSSPALQSTEDRRFKLAESYETSGDFDNASRIYLDLFRQNPRSDRYYEGLERTLMGLHRFADLLPIVEERLAIAPSARLHALNGNLLWKIGKTDLAFAAWDRGIEYDANDLDTYSQVAQAQIDNRLFDRAIKTLIAGRNAAGSPTTFSNELSQLYGAVGDYERGTREVLSLLQKTGNLPVAEGRLAAFLIDEAGTRTTGRVLEESSRAQNDNVLLLQLYEWYLRQVKDYVKALEVYIRIDELAGSSGRELLRFGNLAQREGFYDIALKAYDHVIASGRKRNPHVHTALYGYASTMEKRLKSNANFSQEEVSVIIERYEQILEDFPKSKIAPSAQYRLAVMVHRYAGDFARAIAEYQLLMSEYPKKKLAAQGGVELGNLYVERDQLDKAEEAFRKVSRRYRKFPTPSNEAKFQLAELKLFRGNLDSARSLYEDLARNAETDIANDALLRLALFGENTEEEQQAQIARYAQGELRHRQGRLNDARAIFQAIPGAVPQTPLAEQALLQLAILDMEEKLWANARAQFDKLLIEFPDSIYGDQIYQYIGDSFLAENEVQKAIEAYTHILVHYPDSTLLHEMRTKIRTLRGDI